MSKLFGSVNEVDPHKKLRQSNLALEKYGLSQCGWIWLFMEVDMVMNIEKKSVNYFIMGLGYGTMTNILVSDKSHNNLLLVASKI